MNRGYPDTKNKMINSGFRTSIKLVSPIQDRPLLTKCSKILSRNLNHWELRSKEWVRLWLL